MNNSTGPKNAPRIREPEKHQKKKIYDSTDLQSHIQMTLAKSILDRKMSFTTLAIGSERHVESPESVSDE